MSFVASSLTSSAKQDWRTPGDVLKVIRQLGPIALDPFTSSDNPTGAARFLTAADNAFTHDWLRLSGGGLIFANPEYGRTLERTVKHIAREAERGCEILLLTPARTDTRYGQHLLQTHDALCFWQGRIDFDAAAPERVCEQFDLFGEPEPIFDNDDSSGTFPPLFTYWGHRVYDFKNVFAAHGAVFLRGRGHTGPWAKAHPHPARTAPPTPHQAGAVLQLAAPVSPPSQP